MDAKEKSAMAQKVTIQGAIIDTVIGIFKIVMGILYNSQALVVDGIHSFSDLLTDTFVFAIARFSHDEPDAEHPYGHKRFETLGTVVLGTILMGIAGVLAYENLVKLFVLEYFIVPGWPTMIAAVFSILSKEWAYRFQVKVGREIKSKIIVANAWHSRSDALSSVAVLLGLIFSLLGMPWLDVVMAIVVAIMIGKIGWDFLWSSIKELVDTSLEPEIIEKIHQRITSIDGVVSMHNLRSRRLGDHAILDVNIEVAPRISVSEGHEIASYVAKILIDEFDEVIDVTVHTDVEDDRVKGVDYDSQVKELLPLRNEVHNELKKYFHDFIDSQDLIDMRLHYSGKSIRVDLILPAKKAQKYNRELCQELNQKCKSITWLDEINFFLKVD